MGARVEIVRSVVMDLIDHALAQRMAHEATLAARRRSCILDEAVGKEHTVGADCLQRPRIGMYRARVVLDSSDRQGLSVLAYICVGVNYLL